MMHVAPPKLMATQLIFHCQCCDELLNLTDKYFLEKKTVNQFKCADVLEKQELTSASLLSC